MGRDFGSLSDRPSKVRRIASRRVRASDESGQILLLSGLAMVLMLVCAALVVDIGHAMLVQRQLQAGVDAAALAAAQDLPDPEEATDTAHLYSAEREPDEPLSSKNPVNTVDNAKTQVEVLCITTIPGCNRRDGGVNAVKVRSTSTVPTWFGRIVGISELKVSAQSTACAPCSVKPLDIMLVIDRTGSMCAPVACSGNNMSDMRRAKDGVKAFLRLLDPSLDRVGLAFLPPVLDSSWRSNCGNPDGSGYRPWDGTTNPNTPAPPPPNPLRNINGRYYGYDAYWPRYVPDPLGSTPSWYTVASMEGAGTDPSPNGEQNYYVVDVGDGDWEINDGFNGTNGTSALIQRLNCAGGAGSTHYALALEEAQQELVDNGRANVDNVIIFLSDGAANTMPQNVNTGHWTSNGCGTFSNCPNAWQWRPCGAGVESARRIKQANTTIYTIGYDLDGTSGVPERCQRPSPNGHFTTSNPNETGCGTPPSGWGHPANGCNAESALLAMATSPLHFYNQPEPGDLTEIFRQIAMNLAGSRGRLVDDSAPVILG